MRLVADGTALSEAARTATGCIYESLLLQSGILAYIDFFALGTIACFVMAP